MEEENFENEDWEVEEQINDERDKRLPGRRKIREMLNELEGSDEIIDDEYDKDFEDCDYSRDDLDYYNEQGFIDNNENIEEYDDEDERDENKNIKFLTKIPCREGNNLI
jgi:hypothetical protein